MQYCTTIAAYEIVDVVLDRTFCYVLGICETLHTSKFNAVCTRTLSDFRSEQYSEYTSLWILAENVGTLLSTKSWDALHHQGSCSSCRKTSLYATLSLRYEYWNMAHQSWQPYIGVQYALNSSSLVLSEAAENLHVVWYWQAVSQTVAVDVNSSSRLYTRNFYYIRANVLCEYPCLTRTKTVNQHWVRTTGSGYFSVEYY